MKALFDGANKREITYSPGLVKFPDDNFDLTGEEIKVLCEGVILNDAALLKEYEADSVSKLIIKIYKEKGADAIPNILHGMYTVVVEDTDRTYIINDMFSKNPVYFYTSDRLSFADSSFYGILDTCKANNIELSIDMTGLDQMMNKGVFYNDNTYFNEIKFLQHNEYLMIDAEGKMSIITYEYVDPYGFDSTLPDDEVIEHIDMLFRKAAKEGMEKNNKAGYRPVFSLSGGMDSRCSYLACAPYLEKTPFTFSYGDPHCMDLSIASDLSALHKGDHVNFDVNYDFPLDREEILDLNEGQMVYFGTTGLYRAFDKLDTKNIGLLTTGLGGGEIMGGVCKERFNDEQNRYERIQVFRRNLNFQFTARDKFQVFSPFFDEDFYCFMLKLNYDRLQHRRLYYIWYVKKFKLELPVTTVEGKVRPYKATKFFHGPFAAYKNFRRKIGIISRWEMNPLLHWFENNDKLQKFMAENIVSDMDVIIKGAPNADELNKIIMEKYNSSDDIIKLYILTATGTLKRYYGRQ